MKFTTSVDIVADPRVIGQIKKSKLIILSVPCRMSQYFSRKINNAFSEFVNAQASLTKYFSIGISEQNLPENTLYSNISFIGTESK